ncbi:hypothetical protein C0993_002292 [Termitomyces sp. T159_Od127]|nr:hypothetical protein C0993_002292 [Termitomyces sp. T159_Od127]
MTTSLVPQISLDKEKESITIEVENKRANDVDADALDLPEPGTPERLEAERKLVRKLDSRLLPTVFIIYIMNYIDVASAELRELPTLNHVRHVRILKSSFQPQNTFWMSSHERRLALARISEDAGEADQDNAEESYVYSL